jgi:hypothetical protein
VFEDVEWIHVAEDVVHWWTHVQTALNLRVSFKAGNVLTDRLLAFQVGLSSTQAINRYYSHYYNSIILLFIIVLLLLLLLLLLLFVGVGVVGHSSSTHVNGDTDLGETIVHSYSEHCRLTGLYPESNPLVVGGNKLVDQITGSDSGNWKLELFLFITQTCDETSDKAGVCTLYHPFNF